MKYNKKSVGLLATVLVLMGGMFYASCSSEDDPMTFEESGNEKAEYIKNKVLMLAEEYGLDFKITDEALFKQQVLEGKICIDSVENDFRALAQIKGYYTGLTADGNKITLDTGKENMLKKKKSTEHVVDVYNGSFGSEAKNGAGYTLTYTVYYYYETEHHSNSVSLGDFNIYDVHGSISERFDTGNAKVSGLTYSFIGILPSFQYRASVTIPFSTGSYSVSFSVSGGYSAYHGSYAKAADATPTLKGEEMGSKEELGGIGYAVIE